MSMLVSGLLVLATGCDADGDAAGLADRVLIGEIDDDTFVAVITDADTVLAYVCDGTPATVSVATWFVGPHDGAGFSLTHTSGARLVGAIEGELVRGQYSFGDAALEYAVADADGEAGLFLADEGELRGGWIVRADGAQRGAVLHRTTGDIVSAQPIKTTQTQVVLQSDPSPLRRLASPALPQ